VDDHDICVNGMSEPNLDVAACVERVRHGDEDAARQLFHYLNPLVLKLTRAHLPRRTREEDLAQMIFIKIFAKLDQYSGAAPIEHWVSRIAINTCVNQLEAERIRPELRRADLTKEQCIVLDHLQTASEELSPGDSMAAREITEQLLALLSPRDRLLITLLHLEGHTPREVQAMTGWNGTLIRVRAFQARRKLRKHFENLMKESL
jgi:RNA polymerase sigma-70 factor (ECF subfamily)